MKDWKGESVKADREELAYARAGVRHSVSASMAGTKLAAARASRQLACDSDKAHEHGPVLQGRGWGKGWRTSSSGGGAGSAR